MDWGRAKSVLIISFLILNVILGYQLWLDMRERLNTNVDLADLAPETLRIMQEKNIRLPANIPSETPRLSELTFRYTSRAGLTDKIRLETPVNSRIAFYESELLEGLGSTIPQLEQYRFDVPTRRDDAFVFHRLSEDGRPMFDVKLELYYSNQKIDAYRQDLIEIVETKPGGEDDEQSGATVLAASKAVTNLIENYLQAGSVIREVLLGYHGQIFNSDDIQAAEPAWRVLLEDGTVYYVNAISAEVVTEGDSPGASEVQGDGADASPDDIAE